MRYLGIDFGTKRVGVAVSDEAGLFAFPLVVVENSPSLVDDIAALVAEHHVGTVVVGESKNFSFADNPVMADITPFVEQLKKRLGMPVVLHPEFLTSQEAERLQGKNAMLDASAAALILKSYLDIHGTNNTNHN